MSVKPMNMPLEYREWVDSINWEQAKVEHHQFNRDVDYLNALRSQLREEHPDCYVVVYKEEVVASGPVRRKSWSTWTVEAPQASRCHEISQ